MKSSMLMLFAALGLALWFAGCKVQNPGSASADSPPTTALTVAPRDSSTVNHYIRLSWAGNDPDGTVQGFRIYIDNVMVVFTTSTDSLIAFPASASGVPTPHHFSVQAVDNAGLVDPNPPVRFFYTVNWAPVVRLIADGGVVAGDHVGKGFRVTVSALDTNFSFIRYSASLDNQTSWTEPSPDSVFIMADSVLIADTVLFPEHVVAIPNTGLTAGWHTLYLRAVDAGNAVSNIIADSFFVEDAQRPLIGADITATYGTTNFYPDGSVYYSTQSGVISSLSYSASAEAYKGEVNGYRYRMQSAIDPAVEFGPWTDWSAWGANAVVEAEDLLPGAYVFQLMARDLANAFSDTAEYAIRLVRQTLSDSIIIVSETREGTGSLGSPRAATVDSFYAHVFAGSKFRFVHYTDPQLMPSANRAGDYISPYDVHHAGVIMWHSDDKADIRLDPDSVGVRLMRDFLNKGGRVIISGWDLLTHFSGNADEIDFASGSFAADKLRLFGASRNTASSTRSNLGFDGVNGFSGCRIDSTKLPTGFHGGVDRGWTFHVRGEDIAIGALAVKDSTVNPLFHANAAYLYDQSFRVAMFGIPLYFCYEDQVRALFWNPSDPVHGIIQRMLQGL